MCLSTVIIIRIQLSQLLVNVWIQLKTKPFKSAPSATLTCFVHKHADVRSSRTRRRCVWHQDVRNRLLKSPQVFRSDSSFHGIELWGTGDWLLRSGTIGAGGTCQSSFRFDGRTERFPKASASHCPPCRVTSRDVIYVHAPNLCHCSVVQY